jgi:hypothetical protein
VSEESSGVVCTCKDPSMGHVTNYLSGTFTNKDKMCNNTDFNSSGGNMYFRSIQIGIGGKENIHYVEFMTARRLITLYSVLVIERPASTSPFANGKLLLDTLVGYDLMEEVGYTALPPSV